MRPLKWWTTTQSPNVWDTHPTHLHVPPMRMRPCLGSKNLKRHNLRIFQFGKHQTFGGIPGSRAFLEIFQNWFVILTFWMDVGKKNHGILRYTPFIHPRQPHKSTSFKKATLWASFMHQSATKSHILVVLQMHARSLYSSDILTVLPRGREHEVSNTLWPCAKLQGGGLAASRFANKGTFGALQGDHTRKTEPWNLHKFAGESW